MLRVFVRVEGIQSGMDDWRLTKKYLDTAARAALRGFGFVEPNPMVGAVIVKDGPGGEKQVVGIGHHQRFGGLHAEREALANCRQRGHDPRGSTLYCTLEPCCHHGKQPPCTEAVIEAGIVRVVIARKDPAEVSAGGVEILQAAGIEVELTDASPLATGVSDAFIHRVRTGRPWVIAKWAQTLDGRMATSSGQSQWITGGLCRKRVHRLRARVDAVMVGVGTVIADDPMLTARDVHVRRVATRVVLDTHGRTGVKSKFVTTAGEVPAVVFVGDDARDGFPSDIQVCRVGGDGRIDLCRALETLSSMGVSTVLVEAGPRVLGALVEDDLIDEAFVHLAPAILGDEHALPVAVGRDAPRLTDMRRFRLVRSKPIGDDVELHYRRRFSGLE